MALVIPKSQFAVLKGIPKPEYRMTYQERQYQHALRRMSDDLRLEAFNNNLLNTPRSHRE